MQLSAWICKTLEQRRNLHRIYNQQLRKYQMEMCAVSGRILQSRGESETMPCLSFCSNVVASRTEHMPGVRRDETFYPQNAAHTVSAMCIWMRTVLSYVEANLLENGALQYELEDGKQKTITLRQSTLEEVGVHFYIDESPCVEKEIVSAVSHLLKVRKNCDAGQRVLSFVPTQPTVCTPCEDGTFSGQVNAKECWLSTVDTVCRRIFLGRCEQEYAIQRWYTRTVVGFLVCAWLWLHFARTWDVSRDRSGFEFTYEPFRSHRISRYSPCTSSLVASKAENTRIKCGVDMSSCMHNLAGQWKLGLISMGGSVYLSI